MSKALPQGEWVEDALCTQVIDPELWFPESGGSPRAAKKVCAKCPVRSECLDWALEHNEPTGIWGGLSGHERRLLRAKRAAA